MNIERLYDIENTSGNPNDLYTSIKWPDPPPNRPYVYINMASTVDGKIVLGKPDGPAKGVGGATDQLLFRRLQQQCDAAFLGGTTLRASQVIYPAHLSRYTVTRSGDLPLNNRFFTDAPDRAFVLAPSDLAPDAAKRIEATALLVTLGDGNVDLAEALKWTRTEKNIRTLLCEGGPTINDQLIRAGLADELFLTIGPKLKGGTGLPTIVTGEGFPSGASLPVSLISVYHDGDELYLRYRLGTPS